MLKSPQQYAQKGLDYLEKAVLDVLISAKGSGKPYMRSKEITQLLNIDPTPTATGAQYSQIVIGILDRLENKGKATKVDHGKWTITNK
jgi:hypothetical protein